MKPEEMTTEELIRLIRIHDNWDAGKELASRLESAERISTARAKQRDEILAHYHKLEAEVEMLREILLDVWNQFAVEAAPGKGFLGKWAGGLSTLEDVEGALRDEEKKG